jgi:hypothetical protein
LRRDQARRGCRAAFETCCDAFATCCDAFATCCAWQALGAAIKSSGSSLGALRLVSTGLSDKGMAVLAAGIRENNSLTVRIQGGLFCVALRCSVLL